MKIARNIAWKSTALAMTSVLVLSACETNEQSGQLIGGLLGAGLGLAAAGDDDDTVKALAVVAGAGLGAWIGGNIGKGLDQKERERLAMTTQNVLNQPVPANSPLRSPSYSGRGSQQAEASAPSQVWTSPTNPNTVSGRSTVTQVSSTSSGGECRTVRQLVVKNGQESSEDVRFCRQGPNGTWQPQQT